jgi:hypothetical protein
MLKEIYQYYSTPVKPYVKKLGFLKESIGMEARYQRCKQPWQSHYQQCQSSILQAVELVETKNTIVILGAGSLRDTPLGEISAKFGQVILVDLLFLKQARKVAKSYLNVRLVELDVSNSLEELLKLESPNQLEACLTQIQPAIPFAADCVVSLNLITQLPLIPIAWLMKRKLANEVQLNRFAQQLIKQHLDDLNSFKGVKCLIADRAIIEYDRVGKETDNFLPTWDVPLPKIDREWDWEAVPIKESKHNSKQIHRVGVSIWR